MATNVQLEIEPNELNKFFAFVLDDSVQGVLQDTPNADYEFVLSGKFFVDITKYGKSVKITRGKSRETDTYNPGLANVVFNNHDRTFDPLHTSSPLYTHIIPKSVIRIAYRTAIAGDIPLFIGLIDDWNLNYDLAGDSTAAAAASDAMSLYSTLVIPAGLQTAELTGTRLIDILELPEFATPFAIPENTAGGDYLLARIRTGAQVLGADTVQEGQNALGYFQQVAKSEPGAFFVDGFGKPTFLDRRWTPSTVGFLLFTDDPDNVPLGQVGYTYNEVGVQYGSELLFNEVVVKSSIEDITATAIDLASQARFGTRTLVRDGILVTNLEDLIDMSVALATRYSEPEYRFESLAFVEGPSEDSVIPFNADLGTLALVQYTPNGVGNSIERYAEVISFDYESDTTQRQVRLGLSAIDQLFWTLDSPLFGRLSAGNRLGY